MSGAAVAEDLSAYASAIFSDNPCQDKISFNFPVRGSNQASALYGFIHVFLRPEKDFFFSLHLEFGMFVFQRILSKESFFQLQVSSVGIRKTVG